MIGSGDRGWIPYVDKRCYYDHVMQCPICFSTVIHSCRNEGRKIHDHDIGPHICDGAWCGNCEVSRRVISSIVKYYPEYIEPWMTRMKKKCNMVFKRILSLIQS